MPAAVLGPVIGAAIAGGSSIAGAAMAGRGADKAAKTQAGATDKALAFETRQYENEQARLQPFRQMGGQALDRIGGQFGFAPTAPSQTWGFGGGQTVKIRHPRTGEVRDVPAAQAEALIAKGGRRV